LRFLGITLLVAGTGACALSSCNAILGIEDDYRLDDCASGECGGATTGGRDGEAGERAGSSSGGASATGGTGATGEAGAAGETGTGGGGGPCVATGAEECLNGLDDDCNGDIDCADAACAGPVECVPASENATPSTLLGLGVECPDGYSPVTLQRGLSASADCTGCTCVSPQTYCTSGIYAHGSNQCPSSQYTGLLYNVYSNSCQPLPADRNLYMFNVVSFTECTAQGTPTLPPATWGETQVLCVADTVGGGCPSGQQCAPVHSTPSCAITDGATTCSGALPNDTGGQWYTGVTDNRTCSACDCPFNYGSGTCPNAYITGYQGSNCTGATEQIGNGTQASACNLAFAPASGRVTGVPSGGSCQPRAFATGEATETGPRTVCCE